MIFIETPVFTKEIQKHLSDNDLRRLQTILLLRPESGAIIRRSGGLRKIRWAKSGSGKRGGLRIIYYYDPFDTIYLIYSYSKKDKDDLTNDQVKVLAKLVEEYLK